MTDRYPSMDIRDANNECRRRKATTFSNCPRCDMRVALHCDECKIQTSGCFCTEEDRFGSSEAIKRIIDQLGFETAKQKLLSKGFWVPPGADK